MKENTTLVLATGNKGKVREITGLLKGFPVIVKSLDEFGPIPEVEEDGATFEENAYKKASFTARVLGLPALADDSGICVDALDGAPGVFSARYAGQDATDPQRCQKLLAEMEGRENRSARFECVISIAVPTGQALTYEANCEGVLTLDPAGENGFGYDPVFLYPPLNKTFAEMNAAEKGEVSHRGKALAEVKREFSKVMEWIERHAPAAERFECAVKCC